MAKKTAKKGPKKVKVEVVKSRDPKTAKQKVFEPKGPVQELTPEDVKRLLDEGQRLVESFKKKRHEVPKEERTGTCRVCQGQVIGVITRKYFGDPMKQIVGPGGADQMTTVHEGWHCEDCGLRYKFPPPDRSSVADEDGELFVDHTDNDAMSRSSFFDDVEHIDDEEDDDE